MKRRIFSNLGKVERPVLYPLLHESAIAAMKAQLRPSDGTGVSTRSSASANTSQVSAHSSLRKVRPRGCIARSATQVSSPWVPVVGGAIRLSACGYLLGNVLDLLHAQTRAAADDLYTAFALAVRLGRIA